MTERKCCCEVFFFGQLFLFVSVSLPGQCVEKRAFYRLISGLHASINIHLSARYLLEGETHTHTPAQTLTDSFRHLFSLLCFFYWTALLVPVMKLSFSITFLIFRQLDTEVGSQCFRVQAAFRCRADGWRGAQEAPQPLLPVPDRAASSGQSPTVLPAAVLPAVHRQT